MVGFRILSVAIALLLASHSVALAQADSPTEKLLKEAKLDYRKVKDGAFRVVVESKAGTSIIVVEEKKMSWKDNKGNDVLYAYVWCEVLTAPVEFKPNATMLTRIAEINDLMRFGSLGMSKDKDGALSFFRNGTMFLRGADGEQLADLIYLTHHERFSLQKELKSFVDASGK